MHIPGQLVARRARARAAAARQKLPRRAVLLCARLPAATWRSSGEGALATRNVGSCSSAAREPARLAEHLGLLRFVTACLRTEYMRRYVGTCS